MTIRLILAVAAMLVATASFGDQYDDMREKLTSYLAEENIVYDVSQVPNSSWASIDSILASDDSKNEKRAAITAILGLN